MRAHVRHWLAVACAALCVPAAAFAQASDDPAAEAARLNAEGLAHYDAGAFRAAVDSFNLARTLLPHQAVISRNLSAAHAALARQLADGGNETDAVFHYRKALDFDPDNSAAYVGLTNLYYGRGEYEQADRELRAYLARVQDDANAWALAGELAYQLGDLEEAVETWERAAKLRPADAALQERLDKARRELEIEERFREDRDRNFTVRYEGDRHEDAGYHVLRFCRDARRDIGRELRVFPRRPVEVILYTNEQFTGATQQRSHVAGLYDGKIRLRVPPGAVDKAYLHRVVYHEYAHLVIGELTDNKCPYWLNEGLAQWLSEEFTDNHRRLLRQSVRAAGLPSTARLEQVDLVQTGVEDLLLSNATAFALVTYLRERYSSRYMLDMFDHLRAGLSPEDALQESYRQTYAYLDAALVEYLLEG